MLGRVRRAFARLDEIGERLCRGTCTRAGDHDCSHRLAPFRMRHADDGDHRHVGMSGEHVFHLAGEDIEPAADHHVLLAIEDEQITLLVGAGDVAGMQPAVLQGLGGLLRPFPVFGHDVRSAHADLARLADRCFLVVLVEDLHLAGGNRHAAGFRTAPAARDRARPCAGPRPDSTRSARKAGRTPARCARCLRPAATATSAEAP